MRRGRATHAWGDNTLRAPNQSVAAADAYYRQLCEHVGIALIGTDLEFNILSWNAAAARMFGAAADRMIGTPIALVIPQSRRRVAGRMLSRTVKTRETFQFDFQHRNERGEPRELTGTIAPVLMETGECVGTSVAVRDISRRIVLENELHQGRKMMALGELAGAVAHHFNNILGGAVTSADFALADGDPAVQARALEQIGGALQRATSLISGLQAFAEGDHRQTHQLDFSEVAKRVAADAKKRIGDRPIEFHLDLPPLKEMPVPGAQVATIFNNIIQNALEAMPDKGRLAIAVSVSTDWIVTRITDTGRGLDESEISRIFEPFWSTKGLLTSSSGEGVGLGLAIAHGLVQVIGGGISVSSKPNEGSCFKISIPVPSMDG